MKVYIANFGRENYFWPECLKRGAISTMNDKDVHQFRAIKIRIRLKLPITLYSV